ncbi:MAG TPA: disulfide bond formation protein B [Rhodocyclaceae bacterium]|nr:disulfide bond formation protein B [Rhodocyclaceae bacterium]
MNRPDFPRAPFALLLVASLGLVGGGLVLAKLMNLAACPLCIIQRLLYLLLAVAAAAGLLVAAKPVGRRLAAAATALVAGTGAFVAGYQVWLQRFAGDVTCSADSPWWEDLVDWLGERVPLLFQANGLCSDPAWKFLGLAIADWSLMAFAGFTLVSLWVVFRRR